MISGADFGARLQSARQAKELSRTDIADSLKLPLRIIDELEEQQIDKLPVAAFTVGYLRAYAKQLDLNGDELVAAYRILCPEPASEPTLAVRVAGSAEYPAIAGSLLANRIRHAVQAQPGVVMSAAVAAVVFLVALVIWLVWPQHDAAIEKPHSQSTVAAPKINKTAVQDKSEIYEDAMLHANTIAAAAASKSDELVAPVFQKDIENDQLNARRITPTGNDRIAFTFRENCWVEVKSPSGRSLYSDLNRADNSLDLVGQGPFRIILGYAPGVDLYFNGEAIALAPHTRNNVASITLGQ